MRYYEVVTMCDNCDDEWTYYEGYDLNKARSVRNYEIAHNDTHHSTEIREFELEKPRDEMTDDEWIDFYCCPGYNVVR